MNEWMGEWTDGWLELVNGCMGKWMNGWLEWMVGCMGLIGFVRL